MGLLATLLVSAACDRPPSGLGSGISWQTADPREHGFDPRRLAELRRHLAAHRTYAWILVRHGSIVQEWYDYPRHGPWRRYGTASLAKALVGSIALLALMTDGTIAGPDVPASRGIPAWRGDSLRARIALRDLMAHSSGLPHGLEPDAGPWATAFWEREPELYHAVLEEAPLLFEPGTSYAYSGPAYAALSYALTGYLRGSTTPDLHTFLDTRVFRPLEVPPDAWTIGYRTPHEVDGMLLYASWGGAAFNARAAARIGQLMAQHGRWDGRRLLDSAWIDRTVRGAAPALPPRELGAAHPVPSLGWWSNESGAWPGLPRDAYAGVGAGAQILLVVPSLELVAVRFGASLGTVSWEGPFWEDLNRLLLEPLAAALDAPGGSS